MMKRLRSYTGEDLGSGPGERDLDRSLSAASSSSSFQHRRWKPEENSRSRPGVADYRAGARRRIDRDLDCFDLEGSRGFRKTTDHDFVDRRGLRKRIDRGFDDGEDCGALTNNTTDHGWPDNLDHRDGSRGLRKRLDHHDIDESDRSKSFLHYRNVTAGRGSEWNRARDRERIHRSGNCCVARGGIPKGFRSQRDRPKIQGNASISSWKRFGTRSKREVDDDSKTSATGNSSKSWGPDGGNSSRDSLRSPHRSNAVKSPSPSKDFRDSEDVNTSVRSVAGNGAIEMEEGELQLDSVKESATPSFFGMDVDNLAQVEQGCTDKSESSSDVRFSNTEKIGHTHGPAANEKQQLREIEAVESETASLQRKLSSSESNYTDCVRGSEVKNDSQAVNDGDRPAISESLRDDLPECSAPPDDELFCRAEEDIDNDTVTVQRGENKVENAVDVAEAVIVPQSKDIAEVNLCEHDLSIHHGKDKVSSLIICSTNDVEFGRRNPLFEQNLTASRNGSFEGPGTRDFEFLSCSDGAKADYVNNGSQAKVQDEKRTLEPLDLSLCLPNVSVPTSLNRVAPRPNSTPCTRVVQSLATTLCRASNEFTTSISFSGSPFIRNPLTHSSVEPDCEQSVKSRPLFQGVDRQALAGKDSLPKELPAFQKVSSNVNGSLHLPISQSILSGQPVCENSAVLFRSSISQSQHSGMKMTNQDEVEFPADSADSQGVRLDHARENRLAMGEESGCASQKNLEQVATLESDFINSIVGFVVSEPIQAIAWKFTEMANESIACLKEGIQEIMLKKDHQKQFHSLQGVLNSRSDLTLETLLKSHRIQLEILVAIKTGVADFLRNDHSVPSVDLAEIFLSLKCRNPNCGRELPVDVCECRLCSRKDGFCSMCMCLVCSKFDMESNTCGWVGCDSCSHWCHADCGLQKSYIRNGQSVNSAEGTSEMQFYCVACDHSSAMFGFVKDVFKTCAAEWKDETMIKELQYMKRIFATSNDTRGKALHGLASDSLVILNPCYQQHALGNIDKNYITGNVLAAYRRIANFLKDSMVGSASASSGQKLQEPMRRETLSTAPSHANNFMPPSTEVAPGYRSSIRDFDKMQRVGAGGVKEPTPAPAPAPAPVVDELETLVKIIQAEAKMFQSRAEDARRKSEYLKRITITLSKKMDEEYTARIAKLQLATVEETRRKKLEELQVLERSYQEYMKTQTRMHEDINQLCRTMGKAQSNLDNQ